MKIEYLSEGARECPLIRIYGSDEQGFIRLSVEIVELISTGKEVLVHELPGFVSIANCQLTFRKGKKDGNIVQEPDSRSFIWFLRSESWETVKGLIEPFCEKTTSKYHQWLAGKESSYGFHESRIALLITNREEGTW
jgi:hypothetical protein